MWHGSEKSGLFWCHFCPVTWILEIGERFCVLLNHAVSIAVVKYDLSWHIVSCGDSSFDNTGEICVEWSEGTKKFASNRVEKLCIIAYTITGGIFMWKGACEDVAQHRKDYITLNIKMDAALMRRFATYCKDVGQTKLWSLSA